MSTRQIKVNLKPVADTYSGKGEKIVEYSSPVGGGLISFRLTDDGYLVVNLYREDESVLVVVDERHHKHSKNGVGAQGELA